MKHIAGKTLIFLFSILIIFHLLILSSVIPYDVVWGGNLSTPEEMRILEIASIVVNLLFLSVVLIKTGILKVNLPHRIIRVMLWVMAGFFALNTIGNLLAATVTEKLFSILTVVLSVLLVILARQKSE